MGSKMDDQVAALSDGAPVVWMGYWTVFVEETEMVEHAVHEMVGEKVSLMVFH